MTIFSNKDSSMAYKVSFEQMLSKINRDSHELSKLQKIQEFISLIIAFFVLANNVVANYKFILPF